MKRLLIIKIISLIAKYKFGDYYYEKLIKLTQFKNKSTADNIKDWILKSCVEYGFDLNKFAGLSTDSAANMIGIENGLAQKLLTTINSTRINNNIELLSIHCINHRLNLCLRSMDKVKRLKKFNIVTKFLLKKNAMGALRDFMKEKVGYYPPKPSLTR